MRRPERAPAQHGRGSQAGGPPGGHGAGAGLWPPGPGRPRNRGFVLVDLVYVGAFTRALMSNLSALPLFLGYFWML